MDDLNIWGFTIPKSWLTDYGRKYLGGLPEKLPNVEWVWQEMDRVWDSFQLDNALPLNGQNVGAFYSHPVWLMNGVFTAIDAESVRHRDAIADFLAETGSCDVADYGGGFGELALAVSRANPKANVSIVEPFPSQVGVERLREHPQVKYVPEFGGRLFDAVVAQDVLEHVEDPIQLALEICNSTREGGYCIFANCFRPVIKCHLPSTFHLRHTFPWVMRRMGMRFIGTIQGAAHAQVFERVGTTDLTMARSAERISRVIGPCLNFGAGMVSAIKRPPVAK